MTVLNNPESPFEVPYKGFQYPLPPSWKYAIRQQDQINFLLQMILALDAELLTLAEINDVIDGKLADVISDMQGELQKLKDEISQIISGAYYTRNPVTGEFSPIYTALKQMYDMLRVKAMTWNQLAETNMTWDELHATGHSWFDVDMRSNILFGDGETQIKFTPDSHIDELTPGYIISGEIMKATTWGQMRAYGFLTKE